MYKKLLKLAYKIIFPTRTRKVRDKYVQVKLSDIHASEQAIRDLKDQVIRLQDLSIRKNQRRTFNNYQI